MTRDGEVLKRTQDYLSIRRQDLADNVVEGLTWDEYQRHVSAISELGKVLEEIEAIKKDVNEENR